MTAPLGPGGAEAREAAYVAPSTGGNPPLPPRDQIENNYFTDINPVNPPEQRTLVYSPDVQILIARGQKEYDVSADVVAWSVRRVENGVSSVAFRLSNKATRRDGSNLRYTNLFERMDRVVIRLKRVEWVLVFSGYLDSVPYVQLYPGTVDFRASCTLKRLMHTWWDPGLPESSRIFDQAGQAQQEARGGEAQLDQGLGSLLRRLLVEVGGWDPKTIHIQRFPIGFYQFMREQLQRLAPGSELAAENFRELLLGESDTSLGVGKAASRQVGVTMGGYNMVTDTERKLEVIRAVDEMGMGPDTTDIAAAEGIGTAAGGGSDQRDRPAWQAQQEVGRNWKEAAQKSDAAVHCFMTIYAESNWRMYANLAEPKSLDYPYDPGFLSTDGSSIGLYQQQSFDEWGSVAQRMNVKASTQMFLQSLNRLDWRNMSRPAACQAVQRSKFSNGSNYAAWEERAEEEVRALRTGTGTGDGANPQQPGLNPGGSPVGGIGSRVSAGPLNPVGGVPGVPTVNGMPSTTAAAMAVGKPAYDTAGALSCARAMIGRPYQWGAIGPAEFDCSGLTQFAYRSIGLEIGRNTSAQKDRGESIPWTNLVPGDLIFPAGTDHVVMYAGGNSIVEAPSEGQTVQERPIYFDIAAAACRHVQGAEYGGTPFAPFDLNKAVVAGNSVAGSVTTGLRGSTATGRSEPIARNLFTYQFQAGQFANYISTLFGGSPGQEEKAFINDEPLIQAVVSFAQAGLRNFQSAPNGDFIAYYPDHFGLDGKEAIFTLEDIEMKNVKIDLNDDALATHVYISGAMMLNGGGGGGAVGWLNSRGVATVENEWLFSRMAAAAPRVKGERIPDGKSLMAKFGARPLSKSMSSVMQGPMEFLLAVQTFMEKWAQQYSTVIETTFLPEVFPGMRLNLAGHKLQVYVTEVTHAGDFESGFTTTMTIMAPSRPNVLKMATDMFTSNDREIVSRLNSLARAAEVKQ